MATPIAAAVDAYDAAVDAAEQEYRREMAAAKERRDAVLETARQVCQAVLDAETPAHIKATIGRKGPRDLSGHVTATGDIFVGVQVSKGPGLGPDPYDPYDAATFAAPAAAAWFLRDLADDVERAGQSSTEGKR